MRRKARMCVSKFLYHLLALPSGILIALRSTVHRLTACLAFLLRFSPVYDSHVQPLLEVLQAQETLKSKLTGSGFGTDGVKGAALRKLVAQVADQLC